jgi:hypothetical protein
MVFVASSSHSRSASKVINSMELKNFMALGLGLPNSHNFPACDFWNLEQTNSGQNHRGFTQSIKHMKQLLLGMLLSSALLTGCASQYVVVLTNGQRVIAVHKPKLDRENLTFVFTDVNGRTNSIPSTYVRAIAPASSQMPVK